jgi:hypothetical protein
LLGSLLSWHNWCWNYLLVARFDDLRGGRSVRSSVSSRLDYGHRSVRCYHDLVDGFSHFGFVFRHAFVVHDVFQVAQYGFSKLLRDVCRVATALSRSNADRGLWEWAYGFKRWSFQYFQLLLMMTMAEIRNSLLLFLV